MTNDKGWEDEYKARMRAFMEAHGKPVAINRDAEYEWDEVSIYGWIDWDTAWHTQRKGSHYGAEGCHWIVPEGAVLTERTYSQFTDTFHDNDNEVGVNVYPAHCACGKHTDVTLRYVGSLAEVIREITGTEHTHEIEL